MTATDYGARDAYPLLRYRDPAVIMNWLEDVLGFERVMSVAGDGGSVRHAEVRLGPVLLMLSSHVSDGPFASTPNPDGPYIAVREIDALYERAKARGAKIEVEIADQDYGSRDFAVRDPEGRVWAFGTYSPGHE
jgi:uncharacterized glyoxalase superfamily protein PhnB